MKKQIDFNKRITSKTTAIEINPEMERRMRLIANLIIDRIFEDKQKKDSGSVRRS